MTTEDNAQIKSALEALKAKQSEQKAKSASLENDLVELLTLRQEAQLTIAGIVNNSGGFRGFGGRRGRTGVIVMAGEVTELAVIGNIKM